MDYSILSEAIGEAFNILLEEARRQLKQREFLKKRDTSIQMCCPKCGSTEFEPIAGGIYKCLSCGSPW
jgi:ribosomal protein L37AE/L43A